MSSIVATLYHSDSGAYYRVTVPNFWCDPSFGNWVVRSLGSYPELPPGMRMRKVVARNTVSGSVRTFYCQEAAGGYGWELGRNWFIINNAGAMTTWIVIGLQDECYSPKKRTRRRRR